MLVVSRREKEKVLFPALGISVEVLRTSPKNVRLGIIAPKQIRIIRDELANDELANEEIANDERANEGVAETGLGDSNRISESSIRDQLEAANLAIHLAKNQMKQGLGELAEEALDQALLSLTCLNHLLSSKDALLSNKALSSIEVLSRNNSDECELRPAESVAEAPTNYQTRRKQPRQSKHLGKIVKECLQSHLA